MANDAEAEGLFSLGVENPQGHRRVTLEHQLSRRKLLVGIGVGVGIVALLGLVTGLAVSLKQHKKPTPYDTTNTTNTNTNTSTNHSTTNNKTTTDTTNNCPSAFFDPSTADLVFFVVRHSGGGVGGRTWHGAARGVGGAWEGGAMSRHTSSIRSPTPPIPHHIPTDSGNEQSHTCWPVG